MLEYLKRLTKFKITSENHNNMEETAYKLCFIAISAMITIYHAYFILRNGFEVFNDLLLLSFLVLGGFIFYKATKDQYRNIESLLIASGSVFFSVSVGNCLRLTNFLHMILFVVCTVALLFMIFNIYRMKEESWQSKVLFVMNYTYILGITTSLIMGLSADNMFNHISAISLCYLLLYIAYIVKTKALKLVISTIAFDILMISLILIDYFYTYAIVRSFPTGLFITLTIIFVIQMYMIFNQTIQDKLLLNYLFDIMTPLFGVWLLVINEEYVFHFIIIAIFIVLGIVRGLYKKESMEDIYESLSSFVMFYLVGCIGVYYLVYDFSFYGLVSGALLALFGFVCYIISISQLEYDEYDEELDETS